MASNHKRSGPPKGIDTGVYRTRENARKRLMVIRDDLWDLVTVVANDEELPRTKRNVVEHALYYYLVEKLKIGGVNIKPPDDPEFKSKRKDNRHIEVEQHERRRYQP